jgi:hypothetical protein
MKGTRAKKGIKTKLSVSWTTNVYDPPITSDSHTMKGHRSSSTKGNYKYKCSKSCSSSRHSTTGSKKDKKHSRHRSSSGVAAKGPGSILSAVVLAATTTELLPTVLYMVTHAVAVGSVAAAKL